MRIGYPHSEIHPPTQGIKCCKALPSTHGEELCSPVSLTPSRHGATSTWGTEGEGRLQRGGQGGGRWGGLGRRRCRGGRSAWVAGGTWDGGVVVLPSSRGPRGSGGVAGGAGHERAKQVRGRPRATRPRTRPGRTGRGAGPGIRVRAGPPPPPSPQTARRSGACPRPLGFYIVAGAPRLPRC